MLTDPAHFAHPLDEFVVFKHLAQRVRSPRDLVDAHSPHSSMLVIALSEVISVIPGLEWSFLADAHPRLSVP
jgi:hypothetical protein